MGLQSEARADADAAEVFEALVGDGTTGWGVPSYLSDAGWTSARWQSALRRLRDVVAETFEHLCWCGHDVRAHVDGTCEGCAWDPAEHAADPTHGFSEVAS